MKKYTFSIHSNKYGNIRKTFHKTIDKYGNIRIIIDRYGNSRIDTIAQEAHRVAGDGIKIDVFFYRVKTRHTERKQTPTKTTILYGGIPK